MDLIIFVTGVFLLIHVHFSYLSGFFPFVKRSFDFSALPSLRAAAPSPLSKGLELLTTSQMEG